MGTKNFREDYIEYLERNNANLQNQSVRIKEFESRLLNKELRNKHCDMALEDIKNICNSTCEAIDSFFENFTSTMNSLKNVLMWKSQVLLIPERLTLALNSDINEVNHTSGSSHSDSGFSTSNDNNQNKNGKKCGTAKVCPMIKGHVISAPRIHLNRLSEDVGPQSRRPLATALSPIMEQSPGRSPHETSSPVFRNIQIPLHRLRIENFGKKTESENSYRTVSSPKINFTRRKCPSFELRKRYNSMGESERFRLMRERRTEIVNGSKQEEEVGEDGDGINEETPNYSSVVLENGVTQGQNISQNIDPLEGPSWLLDKQPTSEGSDSGLSSMQCRFVNFKRLNYVRSGSRVMNDDDKKDLLNFNDDAQMGNFELNPRHSGAIEEISLTLDKELSEKNSLNENEESSSEHISSIENQSPQEFNKIDNSDDKRSKVNSSSFGYSSVDSRNSLERKSIHKRAQSPVLYEQKPALRRSVRSDRLSKGCGYSSSGKRYSNHELLMDCSVKLSELTPEILAPRDSDTPKRANVSQGDSVVMRQRRGGVQNRSSLATTPTELPVRAKRRAAEQCIENKVWVDVTPRWEAKIKREAGGRKGAKGKDSKIKKRKTKKSVK